MRSWQISHLVLLLVIANGTPALLGLVLGPRWNLPLDFNHRFLDNRPLLGPSKTLRGLLGALLVTALLAPLFKLSLLDGASFALLAMLGDLCSSFIKRRLGFASSRSVPLLDQLPESLLPLWGMRLADHPTATWRLLSILLLVLNVARLWWLVIVPNRELNRDERVILTPLTSRLLWGTGMLSLLLFFSNSVGVPFAPSFDLYYAGMLAGLVIGFALFADVATGSS